MTESAKRITLLEGVMALDREVKEVYRTLVLPTWGGQLHGLPDALYGYMMGVFARIDLASAYWSGSYAGNQTNRMTRFMDQYIQPNHEANAVAVQMWRHKLMHTAQPRYLRHPQTGILYRWLLHWWKHLPEDQHFTFVNTADSRILNLGLVYLIRDLRTGLERFISDVQISPEATARFEAVDSELNSYELQVD